MSGIWIPLREYLHVVARVICSSGLGVFLHPCVHGGVSGLKCKGTRTHFDVWAGGTSGLKSSEQRE